MKRVIWMIGSALFAISLPSCMIVENHPDFQKPSTQSITGIWRTERISSSSVTADKVGESALALLPDGTYRLLGPEAAIADPLLPGTTGKWKLVEDYSDLDPGSRPSWAIRFSPLRPKPESVSTAFFVNGPEMRKLLFKRYPQDGRLQYLRMKKTAD